MIDSRGVRNRLLFAKKRLIELNNLEGGNLSIVSEVERQQPIQEFFFHLVGAVEFLAQTVNDEKGLIRDVESVSPREICKKLPFTDPVGEILSKLFPNTRHKALPSDPYSE